MDDWQRISDTEAARVRYEDVRHFMHDPRTVAVMIDAARDPEIVDLVTQAYCAFTGRDAAVTPSNDARWVMGRSWYDRLRAAAWTEEQEQARAREHADIWISAEGPPPGCCPVCMAGPFADVKAFTDHAAAMADPANREPDPRDRLYGFQIEVREDGGEPHLASTHPASPISR